MFGLRSYLTLALKVAEQAGELTALRTELARANANADWLMAHVNELKLERAEILAKTLGIQIPVPQIERLPAAAVAAAPPLPGIDPHYQPTPLSDAPLPALREAKGDLLNRAREIREAERRGVDTTQMVRDAMSNVSFEDMGDETAAAMGIKHNAAGEVVYGG